MILILLLLAAQAQEQPVVQLPARVWAVGLATPDLTCRVRNSRGELVRSDARKRLFLRGLGIVEQPKGWYVDHIVPLACGGCDVPSNMSLLNEQEWKAKMRFERSMCGQQKVPGDE